MALFERALELGKRLSETTVSAAKSAAMAAKEKSEQAIEVGKLRKNILVENGKINKLYEEIGKHAFDIFNSSRDFTLLEPLFLQISSSLEKIEGYKASIEEIKTTSNLDDEDLLFEDEDANENEEREEKQP